MNTAKKIQDYLIYILVAVIIFTFGYFIIIRTMKQPAFNYDDFLVSQKKFNQCVNNQTLLKQGAEFKNNFLDWNLETIEKEKNELLNSTHCSSDYVISNREQLKEIADLILEKASAFEFKEDVRFINGIYTMSSTLSAIFQEPQTYLFFLTNESQDRIMAIQARPDNGQYELSSYWPYEQSNQVDYVQTIIQKLLLIYSEVQY